MTRKSEWDLLKQVLPITPRILLYGIPGTGKTYQANSLGLKENQESYAITLSADSTASELMGHYIATEDGGFEWINEFDSIGLGTYFYETENGTTRELNPLIAIKTFEQQVPLTYYRVNTNQDIESDVYIS